MLEVMLLHQLGDKLQSKENIGNLILQCLCSIQQFSLSYIYPVLGQREFRVSFPMKRIHTELPGV